MGDKSRIEWPKPGGPALLDGREYREYPGDAKGAGR